MKSSNIKILLTGGHAGTTAIALTQKLKNETNYDIYWIGPISAIEGKSVSTLASKYLPDLGVKCNEIVTGRIYLKPTLTSIVSFFKIPAGIVSAFITVNKIKPDLIFSFGGFAAFGVVISGYLLNIPIIIHEQTSTVGYVNKLTAYFAKYIAISRKESIKYFDNKKVVVTGNPVMEGFIKNTGIKHKSLKPTIFITGGSSGALSINSLIEKILDKLLIEFVIYHQTGTIDFSKFEFIKKQLPSYLSINYNIYPQISPFEIHKLHLKSDFLISRSGANVVSEILILKKPAILIPLLKSHLDEQLKNAQYAQTFGFVKIINQNNLTSEKLYEEIYKFYNNIYFYEKKARSVITEDNYATDKLLELIRKCLKTGK